MFGPSQKQTQVFVSPFHVSKPIGTGVGPQAFWVLFHLQGTISNEGHWLVQTCSGSFQTFYLLTF